MRQLAKDDGRRGGIERNWTNVEYSSALIPILSPAQAIFDSIEHPYPLKFYSAVIGTTAHKSSIKTI